MNVACSQAPCITVHSCCGFGMLHRKLLCIQRIHACVWMWLMWTDVCRSSVKWASKLCRRARGGTIWRTHRVWVRTKSFRWFNFIYWQTSLSSCQIIWWICFAPHWALFTSGPTKASVLSSAARTFVSMSSLNIFCFVKSFACTQPFLIQFSAISATKPPP